jgi:FtsZ-interacting cell division protein ZipA
MFRIFDMDMEKAKLISGTVAIIILLVSSYRWFSKKRKEIQKLSEEV